MPLRLISQGKYLGEAGQPPTAHHALLTQSAVAAAADSALLLLCRCLQLKKSGSLIRNTHWPSSPTVVSSSAKSTMEVSRMVGA